MNKGKAEKPRHNKNDTQEGRKAYSGPRKSTQITKVRVSLTLI